MTWTTMVSAGEGGSPSSAATVPMLSALRATRAPLEAGEPEPRPRPPRRARLHDGAGQAAVARERAPRASPGRRLGRAERRRPRAGRPARPPALARRDRARGRARPGRGRGPRPPREPEGHPRDVKRLDRGGSGAGRSRSSPRAGSEPDAMLGMLGSDVRSGSVEPTRAPAGPPVALRGSSSSPSAMVADPR
jgi:hypothetical protein